MPSALPVFCSQGLPMDDLTRNRLNRSSVELLEEKQMAISVVGPPRG